MGSVPGLGVLYFLLVLKSEQYSAHSIGLKITTLKGESKNELFLGCIIVPMSIPKMYMCPIKYLNLVIWTLWPCISIFEYLGMTLTSAETTLIGTLLCMFGEQKIS